MTMGILFAVNIVLWTPACGGPSEETKTPPGYKEDPYARRE